VMLYGLRERELIMDIFESITGLRMNHAYFRPGGVLMDLPEGAGREIRNVLDLLPRRIDEYETLLNDNPIWRERNVGVAVLSAERCLELGVTGPVLRSAGIAADLRKDMPYSGYDTYDFDVVTRTEADAYARYRVRIDEMRQSLRIAEQALQRLIEVRGPVMIDDPKVGWPPKLSVGPDGIGNDPAYLAHIMEDSMEALIHHFKMVTQGVDVPPGEVYATVEAPRGELGLFVVSDGGHRPYRVHLRDPSFVNLQALPDVIDGYLIADIIPAIASIDPVMGGVDR
jgi:NADH-quinone oxidoreductase subunit D